jgi:hypothetical protein
MNIGRTDDIDAYTEGRGQKSADMNRKIKNALVSDADDSDLPAGYPGMGAFAKSLILCGVAASCIETLTGLPQASVTKLFAEAAVEREAEFKAGARALAERRQGKIPAQQPVKRQPYTGGLLWQRRQAKGLEASDCFATCGANTPGGERPWEDRRKNPPERFRLHCGM